MISRTSAIWTRSGSEAERGPRASLAAVAVRRVVPNLFEDDPAAAREFYAGLFDFDIAMDMGWIATLASP